MLLSPTHLLFCPALRDTTITSFINAVPPLKSAPRGAKSAHRQEIYCEHYPNDHNVDPL
jgi:hypothetical protein